MLIILSYIVSISLLAIAFGSIILTFLDKIKFYNGVITTSVSLLLSTIANIYRSNLVSETNIISSIIDETFATITETINAMPQDQFQRLFGNVTAENINFMKEKLFESINMLKDIYTLMFPAILILNTLLISYVTYMIIKQILAIFKKNVYKYPKFSQLKLSRSLSSMLIISFVLPVFITNDLSVAAISNIVMIISGIAFLCGLSFVDFKIRGKIRSAWFRLLIYIAITFLISAGLGPLIVALIFVAIADSFFDFRKVPRQEVKKDGK